MTRCQFCREPCEGRCCADAVSCNYRVRLLIGVPRFVANQWRAREKWRYPRAQGGER